MNILEEICQHQQGLVEVLKVEVPLEELMAKPYYSRKCSSLVEKYKHTQGPGVIAEFKRKSPSKPTINLDAKVDQVIAGYDQAGAFACSVLTNTKYFGGSDSDLLNAREITTMPLLRKEFIVDEYQVYETKALGADVMLLIAAAMDKNKLHDLAKLAKLIGLEVLLELKDESELDHINEYCDLVGVNNRNLHDFKVNIVASEKMASKLPEHVIKVSESGIDNPQAVKYLMGFGYRGFLIGENFMKQESPGNACKMFVDQIQW